MRFETSIGNAMSARAAWHEAFVSGIRAIDYVELANGAGVQFTAKGSDNCTMDHCDKGKIQQAVSNLKAKHREAWAWGMWAYAPDGAENTSTLVNILFQFAMQSVSSEAFNAFTSMEAGKLSRIALEHARIEAHTDERLRHDHGEMSVLLRVDRKIYEQRWMPLFFRMKDTLRDLDAIALPPIARVVGTLVHKATGDLNAAEDLAELLRTSEAVF